jgi:hypothetical protein
MLGHILPHSGSLASARSRPDRWRIEWRVRRRACRRPGLWRIGYGHRRQHTHSRRVLWRRRPKAHAWSREYRRCAAARPITGSCGTHGAACERSGPASAGTRSATAKAAGARSAARSSLAPTRIMPRMPNPSPPLDWNARSRSAKSLAPRFDRSHSPIRLSPPRLIFRSFALILPIFISPRFPTTSPATRPPRVCSLWRCSRSHLPTTPC